MKKIILGLLSLIVFIPTNTYALTYEAKDDILIDQPFQDDLYLAGNQVNIRSKVDGDVFAAGEKVYVEGAISQDLFAAGTTIDLKGELQDDVKVAGQNLTLSSKVKGDVMMAGETLRLEDKAEVGGDLLFAGTTIDLESPVKGFVKGTGQTVYLNSVIDGDVRLYNTGEISFGPKAKILGNFTYSSLKPLQIPEGLVAGKVTYKESSERKAKGWEGVMAQFSVYSLLSTLFLGFLLIAMAPHFVLLNTKKSAESPLKAMGIGFLIILGVPVVSGLLMATFIGIPTGLILITLGFIALYLGKIMATFFIGQHLIKVEEKTSTLKQLLSFALGAIIFVLLGFIPYFGWALKFVLVLIGLGGFFLGQKVRFVELRKKKLI